MTEQRDERAVRSLWELFESRRWDDAGRLLDDDFVAEWPHSGERIRGRQNFLAVNRNYPGDWHIEVRRVVGRSDQVVSEIVVRHEQGLTFAASFFSFRAGRIRRLTEYWVDAGSEEPPEWRAQWVEPFEPR